MSCSRFILCLLYLATLSSCKHELTLPPPTETPYTLHIEPNITLTTRLLFRHGGSTPMTTWLFIPTNAAGPIPCLLFPPSGSRLYHGMSLSQGSLPQILPFVRKNFAVLAFDIDGTLPDNPSNLQTRDAITAFRAAHAGIDNAAAAYDYAASLPQIDLSRIYIIGHSSGATLALQYAEHDPRVAACIAFAPACDIPTRLAKAAESLDALNPGTMDFLTDLSPNQHPDALKCPTLLFTATDDTNVPSTSVLAFASQLQKNNPDVKLISVDHGGHTQSMIDQGIPAAIDFLQSLSKSQTQ